MGENYNKASAGKAVVVVRTGPCSFGDGRIRGDRRTNDAMFFGSVLVHPGRGAFGRCKNGPASVYKRITTYSFWSPSFVGLGRSIAAKKKVALVRLFPFILNDPAPSLSGEVKARARGTLRLEVLRRSGEFWGPLIFN